MGSRPLDITGRRLGKLVAVKRLTPPSEGGEWLFKCDCGGERIVGKNSMARIKCCGCTTKGSSVDVGMRFKSALTGEFEVVERLHGDFVKVRFDDGYECIARKGNIRRGGSVRNPYFPVTFGVGFQGVGTYKQHGVQAFNYWSKMLQRAYCPKYKEDHPTYEEATVCDEWHNYQNFADWAVKQIGYNEKGFNLDKDRLVKGNKEYSPETCLFLPQELNKIIHGNYGERDSPVGVSTRDDLNGQWMARLSKHGSKQGEMYLGLFPDEESAFAAYKVEKEKYIKERTEFWKDRIDPRAYDALMSYVVEITD